MEKLINIEEFESKGRRLIFKTGSKQILLIGVKDKIFAIDNRCPHEGYPLSHGKTEEKACVLTCNWHNWKFDLKTGKCLVGGDNVRTYPITLSEKEIKVDLSDPTQKQIRDTIMEGLEDAFKEHQYGRIAREITRLTYNKIDPLYALKKAIFWSFDKFEYGMTHAYATAADWVSIYNNSTDEEEKIICLTEAIDHIAFDSLRHKTYAYNEINDVYDSEKLFKFIIEERVKDAEGQVYSAFKEGLRFKQLEELLSRAALEHYNDFGHSLIYLTKVKELCDLYEDIEVDKALTLCLVRSLCYSTKEDLLPEFKKYSTTLEVLESKSFGNKNKIDPIEENHSVNNAYDWLISELPKGNAETLYRELLLSNAKNFLNYNLDFQSETRNPVNKNVGWLSFTHAITFSNAVRRTCEKYPKLWKKGLIQMASFSGRNNSFTKNIALSEWQISLNNFKDKSKDIILDHGLGLPIFSAHILKTSLATIEEAEYLANSEVAAYMLAAMNRFLSSPLKQKHVRRTVHQSIGLVSKDFK